MIYSKVRENLDNWIKKFLVVPNDKLNGWSPCPYAQSAINKSSYKIFIGGDIEFDIKTIGKYSLGADEVVILVYEKFDYPDPDYFFNLVKILNELILTKNDLIGLGDHPESLEIVNDVCFNQGEYVLILIQSLSDLNKKTKKIWKSKFYENWPREYLNDIFLHREDPRNKIAQK